jgi:hypothetical protein
MKMLNKKGKRLAESSELLPLTANSGAGAFDKSFLSVSSPSQGWCVVLCGDGCCPSLSDHFEGSWLRVFEPGIS